MSTTHLGGLRLDALGGVDHQQHHVHDLRTWGAEDGGYGVGVSAARVRRRARCTGNAPPMTVRISEAWPGQSTSVTCRAPKPCPAKRARLG